MPNCRPSIPDFVSPDCAFETGRITAMALIHKDIWQVIYNDPDNPAVWVDGDYSADLHVFTKVRGSLSGGQPAEVPGTGNQSTQIINAEHTATVRIEGIKNNEDFWNEIVKSGEYRVAFVVGGNYDLLLLNSKDCSIFANLPVEEGLDTNLEWNVMIKWRDVNNMKSSDVPAGIFN